ncbi:selenocysteine-specific translation elongation factor [Herpetosiphon geysericola]|uniref:Selenocysteine-specific elongation factor n=1 Tax=Herpetosiphon geysericola TaxID=70996 RepID=A0A0N8GNZ2_9CHLR|nr:selenocysteine-specific translation elongation factor [Herpetosiphon geysericola]KPL79450.1 hypothetical protein SE18_26150 [Herpetosiphon geysericola]
MITLGTAGHVDHGKSSLVQALTGINPDRWAEEQRRQMTLDLGFAWFNTPAGHSVNLVDVPGHERLIKQMLAGATGFDGVLFVVAADEGMQPQSHEHLQILSHLGIDQGLIVLSKSDLVDAEWLAFISSEIQAQVANTSLANAPIVPVSARTGAGMAQLHTAIDRLISQLPARTIQQHTPRLPIDRVFSIDGFGTVVTGTLRDGNLSVGMEIEIQPQQLRGRIRGLQSQQISQQSVQAGMRVAINLSGIERQQLKRGDVVTLPHSFAPTNLLDVLVATTADAPTLSHNMPLQLYLGSAEISCSLALLDRDTLPAEAQAFAQLRLNQASIAQRGDRGILRRASPAATIAGIKVLDAHPQRHRRMRPAVIAHLQQLVSGLPHEILIQAIAQQCLPWQQLQQRSGLDAQTALEGLTTGCNNGMIVIVSATLATLTVSSLITSSGYWQQVQTKLRQILAEYHQTWPLRQAMPREELRKRMGLEASSFSQISQALATQPWLQIEANQIKLADHQAQPSPSQQGQIQALLGLWQINPALPPSREHWPSIDQELWRYLLQTKQLIQIAPEVYFLPTHYQRMYSWVLAQLANGQSISLAQARDAWQTSRKYAQAMLEHCDQLRITRRVGDERVSY